MSDQMPFGVTQVAQSIRLSSKFLHPVFAKNAQAGCVCFADAFYGKRFAYSHQRDFVWITGCPPRRCCDSLPHLRDIFRNRHKAKTTKDTKYHEGESLLASALSAGPICSQLDSRGQLSLRNLGRARAPVSPRTHPYIMPTGGAGSLGSPALESGILIMMPANPAITTSPARYEG